MKKLVVGTLCAVLIVSGAVALCEESSLTLVAEDSPLSNLHNVYAPHVLGDKMWMGGWLIPDHLPDDKIYVSKLSGNSWSTPVVSHEQSGAAVNDPTVLMVGNDTLMYFTRLAKDCTPIPDCWFVGNLTGLATSVDGGNTWQDQGIEIDLDNGLSKCGAWAPSALLVKSEIWVYYHGGLPSYGSCEYPLGTVFRSRFDSSQRQRLDTVVIDLPIALYNVDVSIRPDGVYAMVANSLDLTKIHQFLSDDGLTWTAAGTFPIGDDLIWKPTPHVTWSDSKNFELWSGRAVSPENFFSHEIHRWQWQDAD